MMNWNRRYDWTTIHFVSVVFSYYLHKIDGKYDAAAFKYYGISVKSGNFFMLWGEPVLGAKKERETKEESSFV